MVRDIDKTRVRSGDRPGHPRGVAKALNIDGCRGHLKALPNLRLLQGMGVHSVPSATLFCKPAFEQLACRHLACGWPPAMDQLQPQQEAIQTSRAPEADEARWKPVLNCAKRERAGACC